VTPRGGSLPTSGRESKPSVANPRLPVGRGL